MSDYCVALLLAGGVGSRMQIPVPKQFAEVGGRPVLAYTLSAFARHAEVDSLYVVCRDDRAGQVAAMAADVCGSKFRGTFPGGDSLFDSLRNGVAGLRAAGLDGDTLVLVHDGVRPLVSKAVISSSIATLRAEGSAVAALGSNEALMRSEDGRHARDYHRREGIYQAQTPQALRLCTLCEVFDEAARRGITGSQSLFTLMAELGRWPLALSRGEWTNFKITCKADLLLFRHLVESGWNDEEA